jgi:hypothetical protein
MQINKTGGKQAHKTRKWRNEMSDADIVAIKPEIAAHALISTARYQDMVERAAKAPDAFWAEECKRVTWIKPPTKIKNTSFTGDVSIKWFEDGTLNLAANCLDRHLPAGQCADRSGHQKRRCGNHLSTDGGGGGGGAAGLRANRRHSFGGVRRVLAG